MNNTNYAEFKLRYLAFLIDSALGFLVFSGLLYIVSMQTTPTSTITAALISLIILLNPLFIYNSIFFIYFFGATPGKLMLGLKIISDLNTKPTFKQIVLRQTLGYLFSGTFFGLGFLSVIKDGKRQAWHDKAFATIVTKKGNMFVIGLMIFIILLAISFSLLIEAIQNLSKWYFFN